MAKQFFIIALTALLTAGCSLQALSRDEAKAALEASEVSAEVMALTSASIELHTDFTIGEAVENAARELRALVGSQLPCAEVSLSENMLSIDYGAKEGKCTYRGQQLQGLHSVEVVQNDAGEVVVEHQWDALSNGEIVVSGVARVRWDKSAKERHVEHDLDWLRSSDGLTGNGSGERTQRALPGGIREGIVVDGSRTWRGPDGEWSLDIQDVEMRWADPAPQAGTYELSTPFDKALTIMFERRDAASIIVTVEGPRRSFTFTVD